MSNQACTVVGHTSTLYSYHRYICTGSARHERQVHGSAVAPPLITAGDDTPEPEPESLDDSDAASATTAADIRQRLDALGVEYFTTTT
jgi:hypothetical protein